MLRDNMVPGILPKKIISWKTRLMRIILAVSVIWLLVSPVCWSEIFGGVSLTFVGFVDRSVSLLILLIGSMIMTGIVYPLLSFIFQCEMDEVLEDFLS